MKQSKRAAAIIKRDSNVISRSVTREHSFVFKRARGMHLWDVDGKRYLDFAAGVAVANVGHTNPEVIAAIKKQMNDAMHCEFSDFYAEIPVKFAETLLSLVKGKDNIFLSNSGTESIEAAYKAARWHTNRTWTIAFEKAFHGRTMGALSMTNSRPVQRERFGPFLLVVHVPYPNFYRMKMDAEECSDFCLEKMENTMISKKGDLSAVFLEPIQGEGGYVVPPTSFVKGLRKLCNQYDALLCVDEVQAGCFRTGKFLSIENFGVEPDIISMAKGLADGLPVGATISTKKIFDWPPGAHANTFGGNLAVSAAGVATLNYMKKKKLGENARRVGSFMMKRLEEMKDRYEIIGDVRGIGLMIGIEIVKNKRSREEDGKTKDKIIQSAAQKGLVLLGAGANVVRICPPLIITKQQADQGMNILEDVIRRIS